MRALLALAALALGSFRASAQSRPAEASKSSQTPVAPAASADTSTIAREVAQRRAAGDTHLPDADQFTMGDRTISANDVVRDIR